MTAFFVTATGTDIGKTYVTCGLLRALRARGEDVRALKPVVSGFDPAHMDASDPGLLLAALGQAVTADNVARIAPWRFAAPLSPHMAAARENRTIDFAALMAFTAEAVKANTGTLLIETVGGIMVPLVQPRTTLDWMLGASLPVILVTGSYLGAISHALSTIDVLLRRAIKIAAIVVNESADSTVGLEETADSLRNFTSPSPASAAPVICLPRGAAAPGGPAAFSRIADALAAAKV